MTGQLRTTLHERADHLSTWDVDLDAIVRDGDRRVRRRRAAIAGGVVGVLVVVGGVSTLAARDHTSQPQPADGNAKPLTYAVGSVIHSGDTTIDVGVHVEALVQTADGFVFSGPDQTVYAEKGGEVRQVGQMAARADTRLVAADDGHYVGWWDGRRFQLWPGPSGNTDSIEVGSIDGIVPANVLAISNSHVWMWNGGEIWVADKPESNAVYQRYPDAGGKPTVQDAAAGRLLVDVDGGMAVIDEPDLDAPSDLSQVQPQVADESTGDLSPDGKHWYTAEGQHHDVFEVFDSTTGRARTPTYDDGHVTPYAWLDDDTIAAWTGPGDGTTSVTLVTCSVSSDTCEVAAKDIGKFGEIAIDGLPAS